MDFTSWISFIVIFLQYQGLMVINLFLIAEEAAVPVEKHRPTLNANVSIAIAGDSHMSMIRPRTKSNNIFLYK